MYINTRESSKSSEGVSITNTEFHVREGFTILELNVCRNVSQTRTREKGTGSLSLWGVRLGRRLKVFFKEIPTRKEHQPRTVLKLDRNG